MPIELTSTALVDDPDPNGVDKDGYLPLIAELPDDDDSRGEEDGADDEDTGSSSLTVEVPAGTVLPDDDDDAFISLTSDPTSDSSPGEAEDLIEFMRPLSEDERELAADPMFNDLRWVDDPAHTDDVLKAGKSARGVDDYLRDGTYGDPMNEELADLNDTDDLVGLSVPSRVMRTHRKRLRRQRRRARRRHQRGQGLPQGIQAPGTSAPGVVPAQSYQAPAYKAPYDAAYAAAHGPATTQTPQAAPYIPPYGQPQAPAYAPPALYQPTTYQQQPYGTPATEPAPYVPTYLVGHAVSTAVRQGLIDKMVVERANWLADRDKQAGRRVLPRAHYEHAAKLWTVEQFKRVAVTTSGGESPRHASDVGLTVRRAQALLHATRGGRKRFSSALGVDTDMGGWNPYKAAKSAVKSVARATTKTAKTAYKYGKKSVTVPLKYGYKYGKKGVTVPLKYAAKGAKYAAKKARDLALRPLRAIIANFTKTMVSRRANFLAKQRGQKVPSAADKLNAKNWAKNFVRSKGGKFGGAVASLMGSEYGMYDVDISLGNDLMGVGKTGVAGLIILGPVGLVALLTGLVKLSSSQGAPPPDPGSEEAAMEAAAAEAAAAEEEGTMEDPGAYEEGAMEEDPGYYEEDGGYYDSSGRALRGPRRKRLSVSVEMLSRLNPTQRQRAKKLIQQGRLALK